jgi:hypothetical protein
MDERELRQRVAAQHRQECEALKHARDEASVSDREPFDLDAFENIYDTASFFGNFLPAREVREHRWALKYYVQYPQFRTIAAFAAYLEEVDLYR